VEILSFIVISYNRPEDTEIVTKNILELTEVAGYQKEIIVINNGSTKSYATFDNFLSQLSPTKRQLINYIDSTENLGVARGRNLGIQKATGRILFFIDDDAVFQEKDVIPITLKKLAQYKTDGVKILAFRELRTFNKQYYIATKNKNRAKLPEFFTNFFVGSGHVVLKEVFEEVGLYTTEFFYGMEEYDLAYKTLDANYKILYTADVTVLHKKSPSGRAAEKTLTRWNLENKTVVAYKYLPLIYVFSHLFFWSGYFLLNFKFDIVTLFKAYKNIPSKIRNTKRQPISSKTLAHIKEVQGRLWY